ncbi:MAG: fatty acid CoA ligase family protein [Candidatus Promineifilaceae bacterium]
MPSSNIASTLFEIAASQPDVLAIAYPEKKHLLRRGDVHYVRVTFGELTQRVRHVANGLQSAGFVRGDRIILLVPPGIEFFVLCYALLRAGVVPVIIDPGIGTRNLKKCVGDVGAVGFIGVTKAHAARATLGWGRGSIRKHVTVGPKLFWGGHTLTEIEALGRMNSAEIAPTNPEDTAAIVFTSGSTGAPKGVVYSQENFYAQLEMLKTSFNVQRGAVDLPTFPPFALFNPALGVTSIIPDMDATKPGSVDPTKLFSAINQFGVTTFFGSPALMRRVAEYGVRHNIKLPTITRALSAGAPMPAATLCMMAQMLPAETQLYTPYGATESMPVTTIGSATILQETQALTDEGAGICVGSPVEGMTVEVIAIDNRPILRWSPDLALEAGEIGEFVVKGRNVTRTYFDKPKATALAKIAEGRTLWHRMGDVGYKDSRGRLWYCGRKSHIVQTNGQTLYSVQCEAIFNKHPDVYRTALVEADGQAVLCVEMEKGATNTSAVLNTLATWAQQNTLTTAITAFFEHPSFPVDIRHNAKIFREKLRPWAAEQLKQVRT